jgi:hypothetical protein
MIVTYPAASHALFNDTGSGTTHSPPRCTSGSSTGSVTPRLMWLRRPFAEEIDGAGLSAPQFKEASCDRRMAATHGCRSR